MAVRLGLAGKLYRLTTGSRVTWGTADANGINTAAAPSNLDEIPNVRDLGITIESGQADVTTRGNNGWVANLAALKDAELTFGMVYDNTDADVTAVLKAFLLNQNIALAVLDGDKATAGTMGLWAEFQITGLNKGEELTEGQTFEVTAKPGYATVAPEWVKVS